MDIYHQLAFKNLHHFVIGIPNYNNITFYLKMQARDKNMNFSNDSEELEIPFYSQSYFNFDIIPQDEAVTLTFSYYYNPFQGFNIYRQENGGPYIQIASWIDNPSLQASQSDSYTYQDSGLTNYTIYRYKISVDLTNNTEIFCWRILKTSPYKTYGLTLYAQNNDMSDYFILG